MGGERRGVVQCVDNLVACGPARVTVLSVATRSEMAVGNVAVAVCVYVIGSFLTLHSGSVSPPPPKAATPAVIFCVYALCANHNQQRWRARLC